MFNRNDTTNKKQNHIDEHFDTCKAAELEGKLRTAIGKVVQQHTEEVGGISGVLMTMAAASALIGFTIAFSTQLAEEQCEPDDVRRVALDASKVNLADAAKYIIQAVQADHMIEAQIEHELESEYVDN